MKDLDKKTSYLIENCKKFNLKIGTAESCTGGLISSTITSISGSSQIFEMGIVTYSNSSKIEFLNLKPEIISEYGAVSSEVCSSMSKNLLEINPNIQLSIAVSGIAGPKSDDTNKEVGLVFIAISHKGKTICKEYRFGNIGRDIIREKTVLESLNLINSLIDQLYK
tara:strand:+ start:917 stop:1414 length:498 start_codon:yes stop_codon:yes gene_type:complete